MSGTTATWDPCSVPPNGGNAWTFANAQDPSSAGCLNRISVYGHVSCAISATGCGNVRDTWDQELQPFTFASTDYANTTFTMPEMQIPDPRTGDSQVFVRIVSATALYAECGNGALAPPLVCDDECDSATATCGP